jgi:hypothetical protein
MNRNASSAARAMRYAASTPSQATPSSLHRSDTALGGPSDNRGTIEYLTFKLRGSNKMNSKGQEQDKQNEFQGTRAGQTK